MMVEASSEHIFQVHIPYAYLLRDYKRLVEEGVNPEAYFDEFSVEGALKPDLETIRDAFSSKGLRITMHGPYSGLNPGAMDEDTRRKTVEVYRKAFDVASILRPANIVLHAGYHPKKFKKNKELWMEQSLKTWPEFVCVAESIGVIIAAEHIFEKSPETLIDLIQKINSPNFRACMDTGHLNAFAKGDMEEWVRELGPHMAEVHVHDNNGGHDDHLPVGDGSIDFRFFFALLEKYSDNPVITIEPHGEEAAKRGIKAMKELLASL